MPQLRPFVWPDDVEMLRDLDTTFSTDRIFRLSRTPRGFHFAEARIDPPIEKGYSLLDEARGLATDHWTQVATDGPGIVGLVALRYEAWNRRAQLAHLYVAARVRKQGIGRELVASAAAEARRRQARCLWVETQSVNYGAIRFYERLGFHWCGLDTSLYDPDDVDALEIAVFLERALAD